MKRLMCAFVSIATLGATPAALAREDDAIAPPPGGASNDPPNELVATAETPGTPYDMALPRVPVVTDAVATAAASSPGGADVGRAGADVGPVRSGPVLSSLPPNASVSAAPAVPPPPAVSVSPPVGTSDARLTPTTAAVDKPFRDELPTAAAAVATGPMASASNTAASNTAASNTAASNTAAPYTDGAAAASPPRVVSVKPASRVLTNRRRVSDRGVGSAPVRRRTKPSMGGLNSAETRLVRRESGGRTSAKNPRSSAFGIGQLTTANRVQHGRRCRVHPNTRSRAGQLCMMRSYIRSRYGSADRALAHHLRRGWY